jgi:molybdenum cofactor cytidylyltransferase
MSSIQGLLLASGFSRRFGANKLLQSLTPGEPVAVRACRNLLDGIGHALAVVKPGDDALAAVLRDAGAEVVVFPDAARGMGATLAFEVQASASAAGWVIALADMPWIRPATIARVAETLRGGADLVAPTWHGRRGHPVGFGPRFRDLLLGLDGDQGAKAIIDAHADELILTPCDDPGIHWDIDTPGDLSAASLYERRPS